MKQAVFLSIEAKKKVSMEPWSIKESAFMNNQKIGQKPSHWWRNSFTNQQTEYLVLTARICALKRIHLGKTHIKKVFF